MDKIKFLMSDTGAEITAACREALEQKGVEVTVVEKDGLKVLQKMLAVRPQVVLLDAFMPGLDALAVKQKYNAAGERHTSFFVTGAFQSEEMVQELLDEYDGKFGNTPGCQTTEDPAQDTLFAAQQHSHYLYIDLKTTSTVSPHLFGHNLEHTRASIMDGLSAQMIRNRKFAGAAARNGVALDWEGIGEYVYFANEHRLPGSNANEAYVCHYAHNGMWRRNECQSQMIQNPIPNQVSGIRQKAGLLYTSDAADEL